MDISILIVNYNGAKFIEGCLDSVLASKFSGTFETILIDNLSPDNSLEVVKPYEDRVTVIAHPENTGFSKGNNIAAEQATGDYLFLLNNDTVLEPDTLQRLFDFLTTRDDIGAVAPKLLNEDGSIQCPGSSLGHWRFKQSKPVSVPFIAGAAVLIPRPVWTKMGGLDENLFFYNDDIDMCKSILKLGFKIYYLPDSQLLHFGGLSTKFRKIGSLIEGYRGGFYIAYKHYGLIAYHLYRIIVLFDILPRLTFHTLGALFSRSQREFAKAYLEILKINLRNDIFLEKGRKL